MRLKKPKKEFMNPLLRIHLALNIKNKGQMIFQVKKMYTHTHIHYTNNNKKMIEWKLHKCVASTLVTQRHLQASINEDVVLYKILVCISIFINDSFCMGYLRSM